MCHSLNIKTQQTLFAIQDFISGFATNVVVTIETAYLCAYFFVLVENKRAAYLHGWRSNTVIYLSLLRYAWFRGKLHAQLIIGFRYILLVRVVRSYRRTSFSRCRRAPTPSRTNRLNSRCPLGTDWSIYLCDHEDTVRNRCRTIIKTHLKTEYIQPTK